MLVGSFQNPVINDIKVTDPISKTDDPSGNFTTIGLNISSLNYVRLIMALLNNDLLVIQRVS